MEPVREVVELIKKRYPWAKVARLDVFFGTRRIFVYSGEPKLLSSAPDFQWTNGGNHEELEPSWVFETLLGTENADPATWELRLD